MRNKNLYVSPSGAKRDAKRMRGEFYKEWGLKPEKKRSRRKKGK